MARTNPNDTNTYVTQYNNLKGVDFTQNPSAVYAKHSPTAVNMISDEGGNPKKRMGWEHRAFAEDIEIFGETGWEFENFWAFEYNNEAHLICHMSHGDEYAMAEYNASTDTVEGLKNCSKDVVGFYVGTTTNNTFCIMDKGVVYTYKFTEEGYEFVEITPKVPKTIIGQPFGGGGTMLEGVNLLTREVEETFLGSSTDAENKIVVSHEIGEGDITISISYMASAQTDIIYKRTNGVWTKNGTATSEVSVSGREITVPSVKYKPVVTGEDNVSVKYFMDGTNEAAEAFKNCTISTLYENKVFLTGADGIYQNYVWWSAYDDPSYFPDLNYAVIGSNESGVLGLIDVGEYLGVVKSASAISTTVYFMYSTSFDNNPTYAVRQFLNGVGAVSPYTFASVSNEQLFLSMDGIYGLNANAVKNRSYYVNKKLCEESSLETAVATSWNGYYILCVNSRCYILDTRQKTGWGTEWTNYSYECYYWENVDAKRFETFNLDLWFIDSDGNLCRFKRFDERHCYSDGNYVQAEYEGAPLWNVDGVEVPSRWVIHYAYVTDSEGRIQYDDIGEPIIEADPETGEPMIEYQGWEKPVKRVVIGSYEDDDGTVHDIWGDVEVGVEVWKQTPEAIRCEWTTPLDADGAPQLFKSLQKKGSLVSIIPNSETSAKLYLDVEGTNEIYIGEQRADRFFFSDIEFDEFTFNSSTTPMDIYIKKKVKKYKRLQIRIVNERIDEPLIIQNIIKTYTIKGYSKRLPQDGQFTTVKEI